MPSYKRLTEKQKAKREAKKLKKRELKLVKRLAREEVEQKHINWRNSVYERDNWTCQICGTSYKNVVKFAGLQPMHILSKENYPQFRYDIMNGLSGCFYCHKNSPKSPHLDGFVFVNWFKEHKPEQYKYLLELVNSLATSPRKDGLNE